MDIGWLAPITDFLRDVEHDPAIRCVLMRGNGKHFMAGGDLEIVQAFVSQPPERRAAMAEQPIHEYNVMARVMRRLGKPIVASVQGGVAGAAVGWWPRATWWSRPTTAFSSSRTCCTAAATTG
jgi:2-(1,2-epoxy-1,2-dihydrophenyl)acetyl-CoA isomerase